MKKNIESNLTYFGWVAVTVWLFIEYRWASGYIYLIENSSFFFSYDLFLILLISTLLFFKGLITNSNLPKKTQRDKYIVLSYILICIGTFFHFVNLIIGNVFFIGLAFFIYSAFIYKDKKK